MLLGFKLGNHTPYCPLPPPTLSTHRGGVYDTKYLSRQLPSVFEGWTALGDVFKAVTQGEVPLKGWTALGDVFKAVTQGEVPLKGWTALGDVFKAVKAGRPFSAQYNYRNLDQRVPLPSPHFPTLPFRR